MKRREDSVIDEASKKLRVGGERAKKERQKIVIFSLEHDSVE